MSPLAAGFIDFHTDFTVDEATFRSAFHDAAMIALVMTDASAIRLQAHRRQWEQSLRAARQGCQHTWRQRLPDALLEGIMAMLEQHEELRDELLQTGDVILAAALGDDDTLGVGFASDDARASQPLCWTGDNALGSALMNARTSLRRRLLPALPQEFIFSWGAHEHLNIPTVGDAPKEEVMLEGAETLEIDDDDRYIFAEQLARASMAAQQ